MLAYLFWHWPSPGVAETVYRDALLAFHETLSADAPHGLRGSRVSRLVGASWLPVREAFEDVYLVDDFAALGRLNEAAVTGARGSGHEAIARLADGGAGGLYGLFSEGHAPAGKVTWLAKPRGMSYPAFRSRLPAGPQVWRRQMVLGPAPEFLIADAVTIPGVESVTLSLERLYPT